MNAQKISEKTRLTFKTLGRALDRFDEILARSEEQDPDLIDGSIQRFEFCIELFWKALKRLLADLGKEVMYPKGILQEAYQGKLIDDEKVWLDMLKDRNQTSHTYDEDLADQIYDRLKGYASVMRKTYNALLKQYGA